MKPEVELDNLQRTDLYVTLTSQGWPVYQSIVESVIEGFRVDIVNASKDEDILSAQRLAKAASQAWVKIAEAVNREADIFKANNIPSKEPVLKDVTEDTLNIDNIKDSVADLPNFL